MRTRARRWAAAAAQILIFALGACSEREPPSVLLVTVDTLRADHVSLYGYERPTTPRIDRFFATGEIYSRAYSPEANTAPSVVSILTGLYPQHHGVRLLYQRLEGDVRTLADRLGAAGYQTAAVVSNVVLTAEAIGLDARFGHYDDAVSDPTNRARVFERKAPATTDAAIAWLRTERRAGPHLLWVHYIDPHGPYEAPAGCGRRFAHEHPEPLREGEIGSYQRRPGVTDALVWVDRYDEEISCADEQIGRLLDEYARLGLVDTTAFVLTADHGETMHEHGQFFAHGFHVWEPIMRVPLLVRRPGGVRRRVPAPVSLVDVVPSVLAYAGIAAGEGLDGQVLGTRAARSPVFLEATARAGQQRAAVFGDTKWFVTVYPRRGIVKRWTAEIDRESDPGAGPAWRDGAEAETVLRWVASDPDPGGIPRVFQPGMRIDAPKVAPGRTSRQIEALKALGYVE